MEFFFYLLLSLCLFTKRFWRSTVITPCLKQCSHFIASILSFVAQKKPSFYKRFTPTRFEISQLQSPLLGSIITAFCDRFNWTSMVNGRRSTLLVPKIDRAPRNLSWKLVCSKKNRFLVSTLFHSLSLSCFEWEWWLAFGSPWTTEDRWDTHERGIAYGLILLFSRFVLLYSFFLHIKKARTHITLFETTFEFFTF